MPRQKSAYPECRHILTNGHKCQAPALTGKPFCHHHARHRNYTARNQRSLNSVELPPLEDHAAIRIAIDQVVFALTHGRISEKLASQLLYAIQLAQNSINRSEEIDPADMVTDYVDGLYGDIAAPAEPNPESNVVQADHEDFPLLSTHAKTHSGHGDTCWEPTNADYPGHAEEKLIPAEDQSVPAEPAAPQKTDCHLEQARQKRASERSAVAFKDSGLANEPGAEPNPASAEPRVPGLTAEPRLGAT